MAVQGSIAHQIGLLQENPFSHPLKPDQAKTRARLSPGPPNQEIEKEGADLQLTQSCSLASRGHVPSLGHSSPSCEQTDPIICCFAGGGKNKPLLYCKEENTSG